MSSDQQGMHRSQVRPVGSYYYAVNVNGLHLTRHPSILTGLIDENGDLDWGTRLRTASRPSLKFMSRVELQISLRIVGKHCGCRL